MAKYPFIFVSCAMFALSLNASFACPEGQDFIDGKCQAKGSVGQLEMTHEEMEKLGKNSSVGPCVGCHFSRPAQKAS